MILPARCHLGKVHVTALPPPAGEIVGGPPLPFRATGALHRDASRRIAGRPRYTLLGCVIDLLNELPVAIHHLIEGDDLLGRVADLVEREVAEDR